MKQFINTRSMLMLVVLFVFSCNPAGEDGNALQLNTPESAPTHTQMILSDVYLSLRVSENVTGNLIVKVRNKTLDTDVYTTVLQASHFAGDGIEYAAHQISFSGAAAYLSPNYTYELSVSRSVKSTPLDFIYWESSASNLDPIIGHNTDHGSNDYVFGLYSLYNLESEQPYNGEGYEIKTDERWQEFPSEFTAVTNDRIDLILTNVNGTATGSVTVEIWDMAGNVLGSELIPTSDIPSIYLGIPTAVYFSSPLGLETGEKYRIALIHPDFIPFVNRVSWQANDPLNNPDTYPLGDSFGTPQPTLVDLSFRTYLKGSMDQVNLFDGYGVVLHDINFTTQEFVVGAP